MSRAWPALERQRSEQRGFRVNTEQDLSCKTTETDWEHGEEDGRDTGSVARSGDGQGRARDADTGVPEIPVPSANPN